MTMANRNLRSQKPPLPSPLRRIGRTWVAHRALRLSYFGGCDYFRLACHPFLCRAARTAIKNYGLNVSASRVTTGNHQLYETLEDELAKFFGVPAAVLLSSGYAANLAVAQALAGEFTHVLLDAQAHPSLQDAAQFLQCPAREFKHRDPEDLSRLLRGCGAKARVIVLTDGLFPHDGSIAPLKEYQARLRPKSLLLVDDAHGAGVL